jgi:MFS family permease
VTTTSSAPSDIAPPETSPRGAARILVPLDAMLGGPARRQVLLLLACVLGLASADQATIGANATSLRDALGINHTKLGLIAAVSGLVAAFAAIPLSTLVDRVNRVRLLAVGVASWSVAMAVSAASQSYLQLVLTRCALGAGVAIAAPACASLIGDFFAPKERARVWSYVLTGELLGTGFGFTVAGELASISWRVSFLALALPSVGLAYLVWRLPEPARGGPGRIPEGATTFDEAANTITTDDYVGVSRTQAAIRGETSPNPDLVIDDDPSGWSLGHAIRYVLRIRTNVVLIVAGSASYFFFSGIRAFGIEFIKPQYGIGQALASSLTLVLGAVAVVGIIVSGWYSDRLGLHGHLRARVQVGAAGLGIAMLALLPALLTHSFGIGLTALGVAAIALAAVNPPLDAGRLDIMHPALWGRAEAVRTLLKQPAEAIAPLVFGVLADNLLGGGHDGLQAAFLIMLAPLAGAALIILYARASYPHDVATAAESIERTMARHGNDQPYPPGREA